MYFFDLDGVTQHLRDNKPTAKEAFQYMVGILCLSFANNFVFDVLLKSDSTRRDQDPNFLVYLFILVVGAIFLFIGYKILSGFYRRNGGEGGEYFLDRLLAVGWVIGLRVSLVMAPLTLVAKLLEEEMKRSAGLGMAIGGTVLLFALASLFYAVTRMNIALLKISGNSNASDTAAFL